MPGWCCCDIWEMWDKWDAEDRRIAPQSLRDQLLRLRNHPSVFVWLNGSDKPPIADVETTYLNIEKHLNWDRPTVSSAAEPDGPVSGPSGVKMRGPYEYVPPMYWLHDTKLGGAYGFATEIGPGPAVPPVESMEAMLPKEDLWPIGPAWNFHAGGGEFKNVDYFTKTLEARYGKAADLRDYTRKAQAMTYEAERAMFEGYGRNKYKSTGVIQWMLNNAWPSIIWHLYDWYMSNIFRIALAATLAFLVASVIAVRGQEVKIKEVPITPMPDVSGGATYKAYCAVCHGVGGKGDGPARKALVKAPSDLTTITARHNGKFPAMAVKMAIVGDTVVAAHGTRDMTATSRAPMSMPSSSALVETTARTLPSRRPRSISRRRPGR